MDLLTMIGGIAKQLQPVRSGERQIMAELGKVERIRTSYSVTQLLAVVRLWTFRLLSSLEPEMPSESVLTGFSATIDNVLILNSTTELAYQSWMEAESGDPHRNEIADDVERLLQGNPRTQNHKPRRSEFHERLDYLFTADTGARVLLGGAAATMADVLAELGITARIHTQWWPERYAELISRRAGRLVFSADGKSYSIHGATCGDKRHPVRSSYVFQVQENIAFMGKQPPKTERSIHPIIEPFGGTAPNMVDDGIVCQEFKAWPALRRFAASEMLGDQLNIRDATEGALESVAAEHRYLILSGLANDALDGVLRRQLTTLVSAGCRLHLEVSGDFYKDDAARSVADRTGDLWAAKRRFDGFASDFRQVGIQSVSLNDEQIRQLDRFGLLGHNPTIRDSQHPSDRLDLLIPVAEELARLLNADRLYLHTNSLDVILRRDASPGALRQEIAADLFAKGALLAALLRRADPSGWSARVKEIAPLLLSKGFEALIRASRDDASLITHGYRLDKRKGAYSLALIPVMWPATPPEITSSAGDISSAVQFVLAGV